MYLRVDTNAKTSAIADQDNTEEFHVVVEGPRDPADIDESLAGLGRLVGTNVYVGVAQLRAIAEEAGVSDGWDGRFRAMLDHAGQNGWLNDDRSYLQGHIVG
jgi:hypothetical protein